MDCVRYVIKYLSLCLALYLSVQQSIELSVYLYVEDRGSVHVVKNWCIRFYEI